MARYIEMPETLATQSDTLFVADTFDKTSIYWGRGTRLVVDLGAKNLVFEVQVERVDGVADRIVLRRVYPDEHKADSIEPYIADLFADQDKDPLYRLVAA